MRKVLLFVFLSTRNFQPFQPPQIQTLNGIPKMNEDLLFFFLSFLQRQLQIRIMKLFLNNMKVLTFFGMLVCPFFSFEEGEGFFTAVSSMFMTKFY